MFQEVVDSHADVSGNLTQKDRGYVSAAVHGHRSAPPVGVTELLVRATLSNFLETEGRQDGDDLSGL